MDDAGIMLQEIGVYDEGLRAFLEAGPPRQTSAVGEECCGAERDSFFAWASEELTTSQAILDFAEKRGALVEILNSAAKITGHNGVMIPRMQCLHKQAWNPKGGDWKTFVSRLWDMGLRQDVEASAPPEYCKWCKQFKRPQDLAVCESTQFTCRRLESGTWKRKL
uniref:Uncharacterized protein n=1 Tax=Alexandrium monilatum TaxID=311494 RepID=A0A7S4QH39_9DINO